MRWKGSDQTTSRQLSDAFETLVHTLLRGPELGRQECLRVLSDFSFDPTRSEIIWSVMRRSPYIRNGLHRAGFEGGWLDSTG